MYENREEVMLRKNLVCAMKSIVLRRSTMRSGLPSFFGGSLKAFSRHLRGMVGILEVVVNMTGDVVEERREREEDH